MIFYGPDLLLIIQGSNSLIKFEIRSLKLTRVPNFSQIGQKMNKLKLKPQLLRKTARSDVITRNSDDVMKLFKCLREIFSQGTTIRSLVEIELKIVPQTIWH